VAAWLLNSAVPGMATAGMSVPGDPGGGSGQHVITATPALILAAAPRTRSGPTAWFSVTVTAGGPVYLGGSGVTSSNGAALAAGGTLVGSLFPGDQVYAAAPGIAALAVLQNGGA
jgi:hypothetical protein